MTRWNRTGLAAGFAAALLLAGTARAQGTGGGAGGAGGAGPGTSSTGGSATPGTPSGSDTANPGRTDTAPPGHSDTATTGSTDTAPHGTAGTAQSGDTSTAGATAGSMGKVDPALAQGLQKLHAANQAEIQMGQMASQTAQDPQVKQFAQQMVDDHQKNDQQLEQLAQQSGVTLTGTTFDKESKKAEKDMGKLHGQSGADFDHRYMSHMVKDHQKDVKEVASLAKRAHKANQTELASFLDQTHSAMQGHLEQARTIAKASKGEQRQGRRGGASRSGSMTTPPSGTGSGSTGSTGATGTSDTSGSSGATAPSGTGSPGAEEKPHKP